MFETLGVQELLIILVIVLLIFGPKKIPDLGKSSGQAIRNFKNGISGRGRAEEEARTPRALPPASR